MTTVKISQLPAATTPVSSTSLIPVVQNGQTVKATLAQLGELLSVKTFGAVGDGIADDTAAINAAIAAANSSGVSLLWNEGTYRITSTITATLASMKWVSEGVKIVADMPADVIYGMNLTLTTGAHHELVGLGFELDANGKCHIGIRLIQPDAEHTATLYAEKIVVRNVEMQVSPPGPAFSSAGLNVRGGFKSVKLIDCKVEEVMMRTGAGVLGSRGVFGILVNNNFPTAGAYPKHVVLMRPIINRVYSEDATYQYDMDGIGIFANPADNTLGPCMAEISDSQCTACWGRDIKLQVSSATVIAPVSVRNQGPSGGINNSAIDFQTGPGVLVGGQFTVDNVTCTTLGVLVRFAGVTQTVPFASRWIGGQVSLINGGVLPYVAFCDTNDNALGNWVVSISNVAVRGSITNFIWGRTNGFDLSTINLYGVTCEEITDALALVTTQGGGVAPYRARVVAHDCINLGSAVPTVRCNVPGVGADALLDDRRGTGFTFDSVVLSTTAQTISGLQIEDGAQMPVPLGTAENSGSQKLYSFSLTASAQTTLPAHGFNANYIAEILMGVGRTTYALLTVDSSGITNVSVGAGANVGTTSDPGSGDLRIWRDTGTNQLVIKNGTGTTRVCLVRFFG